MKTLLCLNLAATLATLGVILFGARKVEHEVEDIKNKTNKLKRALQELDI